MRQNSEEVAASTCMGLWSNWLGHLSYKQEYAGSSPAKPIALLV